MREVVIVSALRTPIGTFGGSLKDVSAVELGTAAVKGVLNKINLSPELVEEVILGNVLQAGLGQNVARQVAVHSGIPVGATSYTINKVCGSGLKAVQLAATAIRAGEADIIVAGGTENMSQAPYIDNSSRWGSKLGNVQSFDSIIKDGLTDAFDDYHMGITAENLAEKYELTREHQDEFAASSQQKAQAAIENNRFKDEIIPINIPQRRGEDVVVDTDEHPKFNTTADKLAKLRAAFKKEGTVTAGNASGINDGAAAVVVMSKEKADELGLKPLATIKSYANAGLNPEIMGCGPVPATIKALEKAGLQMEDLDLVEANEAFASQALSVMKELKLDSNKVNVNGGAIALGHPIGASGARVLVSLIHEMTKQEAKYGLATLCIGGGQGTSMIIERN